MAYATKQKIIDLYGEDLLVRIADRNNDGLVEDDAIDAALESAASRIDSAIAAVADLPLPATARIIPMLELANVDMAVYILAGDLRTEEQTRRNDRAEVLLDRISSGKQSLGIPAADQPESSDGGLLVSARDKVFGSDELDQY